MRAGDHVEHHPSGETWVVRRIVGEHLEWFGWPPGQAKVADCEVTYACTDEEHRAALAGQLVKTRPTVRFSQAERILALEGALRAAIEFLRGWPEIGHLYLGNCPDPEQPEFRDETCPACRVLVAAERASRGETPEGEG